MGVRMRKLWCAVLVVLGFVFCTFGQIGDAFDVKVRMEGNQVYVDVDIPEQHYLYTDHFSVTDASGHEQVLVTVPEATSITDPNSGKLKPVYDKSFVAVYAWAPLAGGESAVHVKYWGCNDRVCFIPQTKVLELERASEVVAANEDKLQDDQSDWEIALDSFTVEKTHAGGMSVDEFLEFLSDKTAENSRDLKGFRLFISDPVAFVRESGLLLTIIFILIGGLALNLTPCVLPMIPINLAIIGAGAQAGSKRRGFALGATYGLGIALVYGLLGMVVVLTGSQFGTIQANPWFNLFIALIFVVLALAMFDVFHIDFSRFQSKIGNGEKKQGSFVVALTMGSVAALLAGACVAPVVIAVLLLATNIFEANSVAGLALPFVLGLGMALPWPFAGAGLSFLPKPGKWMEVVKYGFGVGIVFFALYYGHLSFRAFRPAEVVSGIDGRTNEGFADLLDQARNSGRPVLIDFTASWCKNCAVMEKTTLKDEMVIKALKDVIFVKYVSEDPKNPNTQAVWNRLNVQGLPTFVVLKARRQ